MFTEYQHITKIERNMPNKYYAFTDKIDDTALRNLDIVRFAISTLYSEFF